MDTNAATTVLVDMDGVLADWDAAFAREWANDYPQLASPRAELSTFDLFGPDNSEAQNAATRDLMDKPGFYRLLVPLPVVIDAVHAMVAAGLDVVICTSPWPSNPDCASSKLDWLEGHLGEGWACRAVITRDKTRVMGDILIDDKPSVTGAVQPVWEHVYFTQPYNADLPGPRIDDWDQWVYVLTDVLGAR